MTYINPLANALPQSFATQQEMSAEKTRRTRPVPTSARSTPQTDQFEHQIESPEQAAPIHDEARQNRQQRGSRQRHVQENASEENGEAAHLDLKA